MSQFWFSEVSSGFSTFFHHLHNIFQDFLFLPLEKNRFSVLHLFLRSHLLQYFELLLLHFCNLHRHSTGLRSFRKSLVHLPKA